MKKISFKSLGATEVEKLSVEQLKTVFGGSSGSDHGSESENPKIDACEGKTEGAECSWTYRGVSYTGKCYAVPAPLHCTS